MNIKHDTQGSKGMFSINENGKIAAEMTYSKAGENKFIIDHTEVNEQYRGREFGLELLKKAVEYARTKEMKIIPLCPFAKTMFGRHKEFSDVLS